MVPLVRSLVSEWPGSGAGWVGTHGVPCWSGLSAVLCSSRNVGVAIRLVSVASCRRADPEEHLQPSVVPLERSLVTECREPALDGSERMVFRVGRGLFSVHCSSGNEGVAIGLVCGASCRCATREERVGPSVVSLVRSWVSEGPWPAPDVGTRVIRVGRWLSRLAAPRET